jgi:DNA modification methylase
MFIEFNDFEVNGRTFEIKPNEAYLLNMWTFHGYRGRNLAPYLRYESYKLLNKRGRTFKYSITDYFNKSSIKFKNKLNAKHLYLYLSIVLFRKYKWNFTLKKYE